MLNLFNENCSKKMANVKDYIKVMITALLTALITLSVTGALNAPKTRRIELKKVETNAKAYTDDQIKVHEVKEAIRYDAFKDDLTDMKDMIKYLYEKEYNKNN